MDARDTFVVDYNTRNFRHATTVKHLGKVIAFAMDEHRSIHYVVLDLNAQPASADGAADAAADGLDARLWPASTNRLTFPDEWAGAESGSTNRGLPKLDTPPLEDTLDHATTARLSAPAPFQAVSVGQYVHLFRQSLVDNETSTKMKALGNDLSSGSLLVDRFILVDQKLVNKGEVRFRRSRRKHVPANKTDSLGPTDMEDKPFIEPTLVLGCVRDLERGRFSVLLLETQIPTIQRWLIFACNSKTKRIDWFSIEQSADGLFNTKGTQFYTSSSPDHRDVFEKEPGPDPFVEGKDLVPIVDEDGLAGRALDMTKLRHGIALKKPIEIDAKKGWTCEFWFEWPLQDGYHFLASYENDLAFLVLWPNPKLPTDPNSVLVGSARWNFVEMDLASRGWHHLALVVEPDGQTKFYLDGSFSVSGSSQHMHPTDASSRITQIGSRQSSFTGKINEVRIWNFPRRKEDILANYRLRLIGDEKGLVGYWPCNEGVGQRVRDLTGNHNDWDLPHDDAWSMTGAPIGDHPGVSGGSFEFLDRSFGPGIAAVKYAQKEASATGYGRSSKPQKRAVRVMLAVAASAVGSEKKEVAILDMAVNREGKVVQPPAVVELDAYRLPSPPELALDAVLDANQASDKARVAMKLLRSSADGLTVSCGLLGFAYTNAKPFLHESSTGLVALYFKGQDTDQFFAAYYDTATERAVRHLIGEQVDTKGSDAVFVARSCELELDWARVTVAGDDPAFCNVRIEQFSAPDEKSLTAFEVWPRVSRQPGQFCSILNGEYREPVFVGTAECNADGTQVTLARKDTQALLERTPLQLGTGSLLVINGQQFKVKAVNDAAPGCVIEIDLDAEALPGILRPLQIPIDIPGAPAGAAFTDTWDTLCLKEPLKSAIFAGNLLQIGDVRVTVSKLARTGAKLVEIEPIDSNILHEEFLLLRGIQPIVKVGIVSTDGATYREVGELDVSDHSDDPQATSPIQSRTVNGVVFCLRKSSEAEIRNAARTGRTVKASRAGVMLPAKDGPFDQPTPRLNSAQDWDKPLFDPERIDANSFPYVVRFDPQPRDPASGNPEWVVRISGRLAVYRLLYDYSTAMVTTGGRPGPTPAGSHLFVAQPGPSRQNVRNGKTATGATHSSAWVAAAPGTAHKFNVTGETTLACDPKPDTLKKFEAGVAMTLECWARPDMLKAPASLVHYRNDAGHFGYTLGVKPTLSAVVLAYNDFLEASFTFEDEGLGDFGRGDTIELWFRTPAREATLACLYAPKKATDKAGPRGLLPDGALVLRALSLKEGHLFVDWRDAQGGMVQRKSEKGSFSDGKWHHVALTYHMTIGVKLYADGEEHILNATPGAQVALPGARLLSGPVNFISCLTLPVGKGCLSLDGVRIWNVFHNLETTVAGKVQRFGKGTPRLLADWHFEEDMDPAKRPSASNGLGYRVSDYSGHNNDACIRKWGEDGRGHFGFEDISSIDRDAAPEAIPYEGHRFFLGVRYRTGERPWTSRFFQSAGTVPIKDWSHLAAAPRIAFGVDLKGCDYVDCGPGQALNLGESFALEIFFQTTDFSRPQGLFTKGGRTPDGEKQTPVSYALHIQKDDGQLVFEFDGRDGQRHRFPPEKDQRLRLPKDSFCKVAVIRTRARTPETTEGDKVKVVVTDTYTVVCWWNGKDPEEKPWVFTDTHELDPCENSEPLEIGRAYDDKAGLSYFRGFIGEARLWMSSIDENEAGKDIGGRGASLAAHWTFREGQGLVVSDAKGENRGRLKLTDSTRNPWSPNPDPSASSILLYLDGTRVRAEEMSSLPSFGECDEFRIGALGKTNGALTECYAGELAELRVWNVERTRAQILNNLFSRLKGDTASLVAGYSFDLPVSDRLVDAGPRENHLPLSSRGTSSFVLSTAPIGEDTPQVRSALARVKTPFNDTIQGRPGVEEYAAIERDSRGLQVGVMKRCYTFTRDGVWRIISGFKVGSLKLEWVGQVQSRPTLIGYIEGAPPVPSENLTSTGLKLGEYADYTGASSVEIVEANSVTYSYATSSANSTSDSFAWLAAARVDFELISGGGFLIQAFGKSAQLELEVGHKGTDEQSTGTSEDAGAEVANTTSKVSSLGLRGAWELYPLNPSLGRRWVPDNWGVAVVQSETMDMFALRLAHNDAIVGYQLMPNADIPKDWNLIEFPINPAYTKQGTLDGKVGCRHDGTVQLDVDYPQANQYGEWSYYKPREAYALKRAIDRTRTRLDSDHRRRTVSTGVADVSRSPGSATPGQQLQASRSIANTYVWTAAGGFFAESTDVLDSVHESSSGSYSAEYTLGFTFDIAATIVTGVHESIDYFHGQQVETFKTKAKSTENSFSLNIQVSGEPDLQLYVNTPEEAEKYAGFLLENAAAFDAHGRVVKRPGKVDAYRFMSFYLEPDHRHTQDFFNKVVDPVWLAQSTAPKAIALRQARGDAKASPWRVMHRVTFVSRILPETTPNVTADDKFVKALRDQDIESNWGLLQALEPFVQGKTSQAQEFEKVLYQTLENHFPLLVEHRDQVLEIAMLYFDVPKNEMA